MENIRIQVPMISGDYNPEWRIQSHAQMLFLDVVQRVTPAPLFDLRDRVLPSFQRAFAAEQKRGLLPLATSKLAVNAIVDGLYIRAWKNAKLPPQVREAMKAHRLVYDAGHALILWSEKFNLKGIGCCPLAEDVGIREPEIQHRCWPLVAGLNTILFWHFHPLGSIWQNRGTPRWCPPALTLPDSAPASEELPEVKLRTKVRDTSSAGSLREVDTPGWYVELETETQFRGRMVESFGRWLDDYVAQRIHAAFAAGFEKTPGNRKLPLHFEWAARFQIEKTSPARLARMYKSKTDTVDDGIQSALDLICLRRRPPERGGRKGTKHDSRS